MSGTVRRLGAVPNEPPPIITADLPAALVARLAFAAGSAVLDDQLPPDMPAGEAAMRGVLNALPALLREDSPVGEDLRAWLGLQLETLLNICRRCLYDPMGLEHYGNCVRDLNQRRLIGMWEETP